ncbi:hypothetical protein ACFVHQ_16540 [Actinomycetes bacterium NPDC127524]
MKKCLIFLIAIMILLPSALASAASSSTNATTYFTSMNSTSKGVTAKADYIQWYRGERASQEAQKDHECYWYKGKCYVPDDYYIRNVNKKIRSLKISKSAVITMVTYQIEKTNDIKKQRISLSAFTKEMTKKRYRYIPFHITVKNGVIVKITEQFIP